MREYQVVTVVIPTRGHRIEHLSRALASVACQQNPSSSANTWRLETIVVADSATRSQLDIIASVCAAIKGLGDFKVVSSNRNRNPGAARNTGIENANGEFIAFLDDDDEWIGNKLVSQIQTLRWGAEASFTGYWLRESGTSRDKYVSCGHSVSASPRELEANCAIATPTVMLRTDVLERHKLRFPEDITVREDIEFWKRIATHTKWVYLPRALTRVHRKHNSAYMKSLQDRPKSHAIKRAGMWAMAGARSSADLLCSALTGIQGQTRWPFPATDDLARRLRFALQEAATILAHRTDSGR